jgi:hypothetical protein
MILKIRQKPPSLQAVIGSEKDVLNLGRTYEKYFQMNEAVNSVVSFLWEKSTLCS